MDKQVYKASLSLDKMPLWVLAINYGALKHGMGTQLLVKHA